MLLATPETIHKQIAQIEPGDCLLLRGGRYAQPVIIADKKGTEDRPIVIRGEDPVCPDEMSWRRSPSVIGTDETFCSYRRRANELARTEQASNGFPGVYYVADNARLILRGCQWVVLENLTFDGCWPTAIYIDNCQNITLRGLHFRGGTFAIGATGADTRHLLVQDCDWIQDVSCNADAELNAVRKNAAMPPPGDVSKCLLWRKTNWDRVHSDGEVRIDDDARAFDGDFFRAWTIAGYVILRNNCIFDAFNGIHFYNQAPDGADERISRNILIENNWFVRVRDNAVEPEGRSWNWTIRHNYMVDCYAPFSFEPGKSGFFYVYGNLGWNALRPGPECDERVTGRQFKLGTRHEALGPHYVMHNTWFVRGPLFKKKRIANLVHMNNVVGYNEAAESFSWDAASPFGRDWTRPHDPNSQWPAIKKSEKERFTKAWPELSIHFDGDMIGHPDFPDRLRAAGYPLGSNSKGIPPVFEDAAVGCPEGLALKNPIPAQLIEVLLPDGGSAEIVHPKTAKPIAGAWQEGSVRFTMSAPLFSNFWDRNNIAPLRKPRPGAA